MSIRVKSLESFLYLIIHGVCLLFFEFSNTFPDYCSNIFITIIFLLISIIFLSSYIVLCLLSRDPTTTLSKLLLLGHINSLSFRLFLLLVSIRYDVSICPFFFVGQGSFDRVLICLSFGSTLALCLVDRRLY